MSGSKVPYEVKQGQDKVCPLRMINVHDQGIFPGNASGQLYCKCLKDKCAWWDVLWEKCAVVALSCQLTQVVDSLYTEGE